MTTSSTGREHRQDHMPEDLALGGTVHPRGLENLRWHSFNPADTITSAKPVQIQIPAMMSAKLLTDVFVIQATGSPPRTPVTTAFMTPVCWN